MTKERVKELEAELGNAYGRLDLTKFPELMLYAELKRFSPLMTVTKAIKFHKCACMLAEGKIAMQIADEMKVSHRTVEEWISTMRFAFEAKSTTQLVANLFRQKILV